MIKIAIAGAAGRMGRRIAALAMQAGSFQIVSATEAPASEFIGQDLGQLAGEGNSGLKISGEITPKPDVLIDFSTPRGTEKNLDVCCKSGIAMVIGTTGLSPAQQSMVAKAAGTIPIIQAANYSVGVNVLLGVVGQVAKLLGEDYDIEISEIHHRFKKDAPSGTALALAKAICSATGKDMEKTLVHGREGNSPRQQGEIGMHALRVGDTVGEHSVCYGSLGETITISHSAHTRDTFARGSLRSASWLAGKPAGLYTMKDVLGL